MTTTDTALVNAPTLTLGPLMFAALACSMAIMSFVALAAPIAHSLSLEPWHIGALMTSGGLCWIATARWWGVLSDKKGRRPVMLSAVAGFALCYMSMCVFIDIALTTQFSVLIVFVGLLLTRGLVGLFYAAIPATASALVADHMTPTQRAGIMAKLGAANGAGMVLGPGLVGLLSPFGLSIPLYVTALLPILALVMLWQALPRTERFAPSDAEPPRFSDRRLRRPLLLAFIVASTVTIAQVTVGFFALDRLQLDAAAAAQTAAIALTLVGVSLVISQSVLKQLEWSPTRLIQIGCIISALGFAATAFTFNRWSLWLCFSVAAFGLGWVFPSMSAWAANSVEPHEQGATAGTLSAMQGLGVVIGPAVGTLAYSVSLVLPYFFVAILLLIGSVITREKVKKHSEAI